MGLALAIMRGKSRFPAGFSADGVERRTPCYKLFLNTSNEAKDGPTERRPIDNQGTFRVEVVSGCEERRARGRALRRLQKPGRRDRAGGRIVAA